MFYFMTSVFASVVLHLHEIIARPTDRISDANIDQPKSVNFQSVIFFCQTSVVKAFLIHLLTFLRASVYFILSFFAGMWL